jgi:hypothetical protein
MLIQSSIILGIRAFCAAGPKPDRAQQLGLRRVVLLLQQLPLGQCELVSGIQRGGVRVVAFSTDILLVRALQVGAATLLRGLRIRVLRRV